MRRSRSPSPRVRPARVRHYYVQNGRGEYLVDAAVPFTWSKVGARIAFRSHHAAEQFIVDHFIGLGTARAHGIRAVVA